LCPEDSLSKYNFTSVFFDSNVRYNRYDNSNDLYLDYILNPEGYYRYYTSFDRYPFYYIRDHIGNICQTWIYPAENYKVCVQKMQYYPSGLAWDQQSGAIEHPYRYNGKEFVEQFSLDEYDSKARWYYPAIARTTTMDPLCEKYYDISPYAWCGNNIVRNVDLNGRDWYQNNESQYYTWFDDDKEDYKGYSYYGPAGSLLGEFESIIDNLLVNIYKVESLYSNGFTFDIVPNDKGALIGSKIRDWDFLDEFVFNEGPEFSVFLSDHPYTQEISRDTRIKKAQNLILNENSVQGQVVGYKGGWNLWDVISTPNIFRQFIGSYRYDSFINSTGKNINNIISDSKSVRSLFYHIPAERWNQRRNVYTHHLGNTYQFYIWSTYIKY